MKTILLCILFVTAFASCGKNTRCPYGTDQGCGCYDTGNPSEPGTANGWTPLYYDFTFQECYWVDGLGNYRTVNQVYCTCN
jgi:hypothetical protein